jgi:DNA repair protein RadC
MESQIMVSQIFPVHTSLEPKTRLLEYGPRSLTTAELISVITGLPEKQTQALIAKFSAPDCEGLTFLRQGLTPELLQGAGLRPARTATLLASLELGRRVFLPNPSKKPPVIDTPELVYELLRELAFAPQEQFVVLILDTKNRLIAQRTISCGTLDETIAHPRDVFRDAVRVNAAGIIVAHNHPSAQTDPSKEDLRLTEQLITCGKTLQIPVLDHMIVGTNGFTSLRRTTNYWRT